MSAPLRVLVVDDNEAYCQVMVWTIELFGYEVRRASRASDALSLIDAFHPHIVMLDISLPDMSGYDLCRIIREKHGDAIMLIAQTGWSGPEHRKRSQEAGFNHHLVKPVDTAQLQQICSSLLTAKGVA